MVNIGAYGFNSHSAVLFGSATASLPFSPYECELLNVVWMAWLLDPNMVYTIANCFFFSLQQVNTKHIISAGPK